MTLRDHQAKAGRGNKGKPKSPAHRAKLADILKLARAKKRRQARDRATAAQDLASRDSRERPAPFSPPAATASHPGSPNPQRRRGLSTTTARRHA